MDGNAPSSTELAGIPSMNGLTAEEAQFVYNCEVLGLPVKAAAVQAGMPPTMISRPHIQQARELLKREIRGNLAITKEDVVFGITEAIHRARILAEPMTEIVGWEKVAKLLGYNEPQKIDVNITSSIDALKGHVRGMSDADLARVVGASDVIDADFYEVKGP